jgi:hypothetical protein
MNELQKNEVIDKITHKLNSMEDGAAKTDDRKSLSYSLIEPTIAGRQRSIRVPTRPSLSFNKDPHYANTIFCPYSALIADKSRRFLATLAEEPANFDPVSMVTLLEELIQSLTQTNLSRSVMKSRADVKSALAETSIVATDHVLNLVSSYVPRGEVANLLDNYKNAIRCVSIF